MLDGDIKSYLSAEVSTVGTNGGPISNNQVISGVVNNVIPHISRKQRADGVPHLYRKLFDLVADVNNGTLLNTWKWIERVKDAGDFVTMFAGTHTDTQADITGTERHFGYAFLKSDVAADALTFTVTVKHADLATGARAIFQAGDFGRMADMDNPIAEVGNEVFKNIDTVSVDGLDVTITLTEAIGQAFAVADGAFFVSIIDKGNIGCAVTNFTQSRAGIYDNATYPVETDNQGTRFDHVTLNYTDATHFTAVGTSGRNYGSGDTGTDFSPINPDTNKPYFTLLAAGHNGTAQQNDTIELDLTPASFAYWLDLTVPSNCPSLSNNKVTGVTAGESDS